MLDWTITYPDSGTTKQMGALSHYELNVVELLVRQGLATIDDSDGADAGRAAALRRIALEREIRRRSR